MIRAAVSIWILSAVVCLGRGHHHNHEDHQHESDRSATNLELVSSANTEFATRLYKKLAAQTDLQGKNIFFSPICVTLALAALSVGARGDTYMQLFTGLGFNSSSLTQSDVDKAFLTLLTGLNGTSVEDVSAGTALFVEETFKPEPQYMEVVKQSYLADVFTVDFTNTTESINTINKYVEKKTNGKIEKLVEDLDPSTLMYLVSYMYFKGKWELPFDPKNTREDLFHVDEQTKVPVQMMYLGKRVNSYYDVEISTSVLQLHYKGSRSMLLVLPKNGLAELEEVISQNHINKWLKWMERGLNHVFVPKFSIKTSYELNNVLSEMGMPDMFGPRADFSGMSASQRLSVTLVRIESHNFYCDVRPSGDLFIFVHVGPTSVSCHSSVLLKVMHKATLDVDEAGATAAAATEVRMLGSCRQPINVNVMKFNRPFMVLIVEAKTENILFMGKIDNDELAYREEVEHLVGWCTENNLDLNVKKTKEVIIDFRKKRPTHTPLYIDGAAVETVETIKFLGVHISSDLSWTQHTSSLAKKALQRMHFLRRLRRAHLSPNILTTFYRGTVESILTNCISIWHQSCSAMDLKSLQRVVRAAEKVIGTSLTSIKDIARNRHLAKAGKIIADSTHPNHGLFSLLPSGRRYRGLRCRTTRFCNSFFPTAIRLLNSNATDLELVSSANTEFATRLYKKLAAQTDLQGKNIFFSPICVTLAVAALSVGARGDTYMQLFTGLGFNSSSLTQSDVDKAFLTLLTGLNGTSVEDVSAGTALFVEETFKPEPQYMEVVKQSYLADVFTVDFTNTIESINTINKYVEEKTNGKIEKLVEDLDPSTLMDLVSYMYFKGKWELPFDPKNTREDLFHVDEQTKVPVQMMFLGKRVDTYYDVEISTSVLQLHYKGSRSMLLVLPKNGLAELEEVISQNHINKWLKWMERGLNHVFVPKFSIKTSYELNNVLSELGMPDMFGPRADFSGMSASQRLFVTLVRIESHNLYCDVRPSGDLFIFVHVMHKATLDVDEAGATAAAATEMRLTGSCRQPINVNVLKFNRPFMVLIVEAKTENILFMGKISTMIRAAVSIWILSAVVCLGRGHHHHNHEDHQHKSGLSATNLELVSSANTEFATRLYKKLAAQTDLQGKNIFFSPICVTLALAALSVWARGDTYMQLFTGLGFNSSSLTQSDVDKAFLTLLTGLNGTSVEDVSAGTALFVEETFKPEPQYMEVVKQSYLADSINTINKYVEEKTNGKIEKLVEDLDPSTLMDLVSYMYFKGKWELPFDPETTREDLFHVDEQTKVPVQMMFLGKRVNTYYDVEISTSVLQLHYKGSRSMLLVLPKNGLAELEEVISQNHINKWLKWMKWGLNHVFVPKFSIKTSYELNNVLSEMGMPDMFGPRADFSGMSASQRLFVTLVRIQSHNFYSDVRPSGDLFIFVHVMHKATLDVDEAGATAAAATEVRLMGSCPQPINVNVLKFNRPFMVLIVEAKTENILFMGKIFTMIRAAVSIWILSAVVCLGRGHHHNHEDHQHESDLSATNLELVSSANTEFATRLYKKLAAQTDLQGKNIFFSPICVTLALTALSVGARGDTYMQLFTGLGFNSSSLTQSDVDKAFLTLLTGLNGTSVEDVSAGTALFVEETFKPEPQYMEVVKQSYLADGFTVNFTNTTESINTINKYVEEKTNGKIEKLVEDLDPSTLMYLVSYMYFKGKWELQFDPKNTMEDLFHVDEQTKVPVQMMELRKVRVNTYYDVEISTSVLQLHYNGSRSMLLVLPKNGLAELEEVISQNHINKWLKWMKRGLNDVFVPKFSIKTSYSLNNVLSEMGMPDMFGPRANFSGMSASQGLTVSEVRIESRSFYCDVRPSGDLFIFVHVGPTSVSFHSSVLLKVVHKATLDVDEAGATAAAATGVLLMPLSFQHINVLKFNRPFMVLIVEAKTENILFMGKIVNPNI
ncbi:Serine protease inhibitor A3L [Merluccius polli]|uniref:Thyroxine-binding globulin n=1 Tax=Merluccius polli TaxID=89951 RepID=A0AA47MCC4_MERPO|nr:Serine protease inhibitor A3L [Merluccius polli]